MKILFCTHDIDCGGSARSLMTLIDHLRGRHDIFIVSFAEPSPERLPAQKYQEWQIPVAVFPWNVLPAGYVGVPGMPPHHPLPQQILDCIPQLKELASKMDCVCFNGFPSTAMGSVLPPSVPRFLIAREVILKNRAAVFRYLKRQVDRAAAISPAEAAQLDEMGIPHTVVFNAPLQKPEFVPLPPFPVKVGVFTQFTPYKGLDILAMAVRDVAPLLRQNGAAVHLHGGGNPQTMQVEMSIKNFIEQEGIGDVLLHRGWAVDVEKAMRDFHCILRPDATGAPWGRDIIEAMSIGRPVIATGTCDVFVKSDKTGWLVKPQDADALAGAIAKAAVSPALLTDMARNAFEFAAENFDPGVNASRIEAEMLIMISQKKK